MIETYSHEFNWWQKTVSKLTTMWRINKDSVDFKWGYFAPRFGLEFVINRGGYFDPKYSVTFAFIWGVFNIKLPFKTRLGEGCSLPKYGFVVIHNSIMFYTGGKFDESWGQVTQGGCKSWDLPFLSCVFEGHHIKDKKGNWINMDKIDSWKFRKHKAKSQEFKYRYNLNSGRVQEVKATVTEERRQWHRKWLPFMKIKNSTIDIKFSEEVGEQAGSYKGGCTGCGYELLPNETAEQCLRRMEKERRF